MTEPQTAAEPVPPPWMATTNITVPVLPVIASRLISMAADPDVPILELSKLISKDQVLASRLLGLANSAYHAAMQQISTITEAIIRVGANGVRNMVVTVCFSSRLYDPNVYGPQGRSLTDHGVGAAYVARLLAERIEESEDEAFLAGLLHDIGKLLVYRQAHDHQRRSGVPLPAEEIDAAVAAFHPAMGGLILQRWRLPLALEEPVRWHHEPARATTAERRAKLVYLADRLTHRYGFGCAADGPDIAGDPVFEELGLDAEWLAETDTRAPGLFEVARKALG